ncbi:hypothetical protein BGW41_004420 [Actinomortierella wolfii]|nr:hypothetical protein BGW41_004420 [Actinomortierella wolfii]
MRSSKRACRNHNFFALADTQGDYTQQQPAKLSQTIDINNQTTSTDGRLIWAVEYPEVTSSVLDQPAPSGGGKKINPNHDDDYDNEGDNSAWYEYHGRDVPGPKSHIDDDIRQMVRDMTLRELAGQMTQIEIGQLITNGELDRGKVEYWIREWGVGSFLDTPSNLDSVHGANYVDGAILFPQQIGLAATFNPVIAEEVGRITAKDTRTAGIPWVFGPILDVAVHKMWPRVYETFGEDPHVISQFGRAIIHGLQGNYKEDRYRVAACMKHFIGYSASRDGKDKSSAWIPENFLLDYFVPSFQAAVNVGVATAMETYIDVNGQPVVGSHYYLKELLRDRLGFRGMLVSDWAEGDRLFSEHKTVGSPRAAQYQMLKETTIDMVMTPDTALFPEEAARFVEQGRIDRERLEEAAGRVLQLKKDLGLFEHPKGVRRYYDSVGSQQDVEVALAGIRESLTLLKNKNNVLPLRAPDGDAPRILVTGPASDSLRALAGGWTIKWQGADNDDWFQNRGTTILKGLQREFGADQVRHVPSVGFNGETTGPLWSLLDAVDRSDVVVVCLGEAPYAEIIGNIDDFNLPKGQLGIIDAIRAHSSRVKIVLVLVEGRPRGLDGRADLVDAVLMSYLPGPWAGGPIAEVLSGAVNPSGRLPMTYPSNTGSVGSNYFRSGVDPYDPLYAFSSGLSYSTVEYSELRLDESTLYLGDDVEDMRVAVEQLNSQLSSDEEGNEEENEGEGREGELRRRKKKKNKKVYKKNRESSHIRASVYVKNTRGETVKETVFWYITQNYRPEVQPEKFLLKGFEKVSLSPGESKRVEFEIRSDMLIYHGRDLRAKIAPGDFTLTVNAMRPEALSAKFKVV